MYATTRLTVIARRNSLKGHVGILITGNLLGLVRPQELFARPRGRAPIGLLIEFTSDGVRRQLLYDAADWIPVRDIEQDVAGAIDRLLQWVRTNPVYDPISRNCQHFVSFVETGKSTSPAVTGVALTGLAVAIWWGLGGFDGPGSGAAKRK
jgi:hypothetical protein